MDIKTIKDPGFLKDLSIEELNVLANDIRSFLLESVSKTGGHLSSNLGVVELTIALHYVFNAPKDKILFDVGHQSYIHKILTGRADQMDSLRQYKGIAGFQKRRESEYDCFEAGHSSTALSAALGMAVARDLDKDDYNIIPVVGDASMMSGLSLEALNQIGYNKNKVIIVFNDNNMSIDRNVGALSKAFYRLRQNKTYNEIKTSIKDSLRNKEYGQAVINTIHRIKNRIQNSIVDSGIFNEFDIYYLGPIDGNNIEELIRAFEIAKDKEYTCVIHCVTKKGKGYKYTEADKTGLWHGVGKFDIETGEFLSNSKEGYKSCSKVVADTVAKLMEDNEDIVAITPAMKTGSALNDLFDKYPDRSFDCGIAEDHAVVFASGLALNNKHPFISLYSSFAQRAYDQLNHELARMDLPVVIGLDRSGLVGEDGETHHGVYDISFIRPLPNVILCQGKDSEEMKNLVYTGFNTKHPFFIRYERNSIECDDNYNFKNIKIGSWEYLNKVNNPLCSILAYGIPVSEIDKYVKNNKLRYNVINTRFIKPIDYNLLDELILLNKPIYIYTADIIKGGIADEILEYINNYEFKSYIDIIGIDDKYINHGSIDKLKKANNLDIIYLFKKIRSEI